jgi:transcriptional regulator with XRE-family HTH domain
VASGSPIGTRIAKRRQVLGITQDELAHELRRLTGRPVSPSTVANWERGKHYPQRYLGALEEVLGVSLEDDGPDPREEELRDMGTDRGGFLDPGEVEQLVYRYRQRRKRPPETRAG